MLLPGVGWGALKAEALNRAAKAARGWGSGGEYERGGLPRKIL